VKAAHVKLVDNKRAHMATLHRERTDNEASDCQCADGSGTDGQCTECNCPDCRRPCPSSRHCAGEHLPRLHGAGLWMSRVHLVHSFTSVLEVFMPGARSPHPGG
jgi:hypothetical protein